MSIPIPHDQIRLGETYVVAIQPRDADANPVMLDETWQAAMRVTAKKVGGELVAEPTLTIADGVAQASIDTGDSPWTAGVYFWDARLTDPDGNDIWTDPIKLTLFSRNTPAS